MGAGGGGGGEGELARRGLRHCDNASSENYNAFFKNIDSPSQSSARLPYPDRDPGRRLVTAYVDVGDVARREPVAAALAG